MKKQRSAFREWVEKQIKEPGLKLRTARFFWEDTQNPAFVWRAIEICISPDTQAEFPTWVRQYLADCARRMFSPASIEKSDLRKALPGIMGFALKRGPGNPLNLGTDDQFVLPAMKFAIEIEKGAKPTDALRAASESLDPAGRTNEKTLQLHIKRYFSLAKAPRTNAEWKRAIRAWYIEAFGPFISEFREISS
jgi:hypothetical protein